MTIDFEQRATAGVRRLTPYQPGKPIEELERELGIRDSLKLASNENPLGPSPLAVQAATDVLSGINIYPDGSGHQLRPALAEQHGVTTDCITLGNGSNDVLELIARAFMTFEDAAVFSEYAFAVYPIVTQAIGATLQVAKALSADHDQMPYGHDLDAIKNNIDARTKVVFIANPNNPTGTWLNPTELHNFLTEVPNDVIVVLDEAYFEYMPDERKPDSIRWLKEFQNLIITRTFSKIYGLAGLRIGYSISDPQIANLLNRVRQPFNVNSAALAAATAALNDKDHLVNSIELNNKGMRQLNDGFAGLSLPVIPSMGNFISVDVKQPAVAVYEALLRKGVIVRPIANYGLPNHLRITIGSESQNKRVLDALKQVLK